MIWLQKSKEDHDPKATAKEDEKKKEEEDEESKTKLIVVTSTGKEEEKNVSLQNNPDQNQQAIETTRGVTYKATKDDDTLTGVSSLKDTSKDDGQTNEKQWFYKYTHSSIYTHLLSFYLSNIHILIYCHFTCQIISCSPYYELTEK